MAHLSISSKNPITQQQLIRLKRAVQPGPVLITTHDNPDPDALAAGKAINKLINGLWGIPTRLFYNGLVGRTENWAMLNLVTPEWMHVRTRDESLKFSSVVYVDCQPASRNMFQIDETLPMIVIDHHHLVVDQNRRAVYTDIRLNVGSTVTMIYQYLAAAHVEIDPILATAMFYGIRSDTAGLSKGATVDDGIIYVKLLEKLDHQLLLKIESAGLAREYYQAFTQGIKDARIHGNAIIANLGNMHRPDLAAELADLLLRYEGAHVALCSGVYKQELHFSIRTGLLDQDAGLLVQKIIFPPGKAGGHGVMAGGQIPLNSAKPKEIKDFVLKLEQRFLESLGETAVAIPLLQDRET